MIETDLENTTFQRALVFYQQYLVSERQEFQSCFPRNGKSPATADDDANEDAYDCELRNITTMLESQKKSPRPPVRDFNLFKQADGPGQKTAMLKDLDAEPYINPFTGQLIVPDTKYTPTSSKGGSMSGLLEPARPIDSIPIIDVPSAQKDTASCISVVVSEARDGELGQSTSPTPYTASKPFSMKRKPVKPPPTPAGAYSPLSEPPVIGTQSSQILSATKADGQLGQNSEKIFLESAPALENPIGPLRSKRQIQRPTGSFHDQKVPGTPIKRQTLEEKLPLVPVLLSANRESLGQSTASSDVMLDAQNPTTPTSSNSRQSHESLQGSISQSPLPQNMISPASVLPQYRNVSNSSLSADELNSQSSSTAAHNRIQSSRPPFPSNPVHNISAVRFRPQPSFNANELGKFGSQNRNQAHFTSSSQLQPGLGRTVCDQFQNEDGSGRVFPIRENNTSKLKNRGKTSTSRGFPKQATGRPGSRRRKIRSASEYFPPSTFSADPAATKVSTRPCNILENDQMQPVFDSSQHRRIDWNSIFNEPLLEWKNKISEASEGNGNNVPGQASEIAQIFATFNGGVKPKDNSFLDSSSTRESSSDHPFCQQHLNSASSSRNVSQTKNVTHQTGLPTWSPSQDVHSSGGAFGLSSEQPQRSCSFGSSEDQNDIVPNQLKQKGLGPRSFFDARHADKPSDEQQESSSLGGKNRRFPSQLAVRSSEGWKNAASNLLEPSESKKKNRIRTENHSRQSMSNATFEEHKSSTKIHCNSQIEDDLGLAQIIAALQKMEDDWNREEDQREFDRHVFLQFPDEGSSFATLDPGFGKHLPPFPWETSSRSVDDPVAFSVPSNTGERHPNVVISPVGSNPAQLQLAAPQRVSSSGTKKAKSQIECTVCRDSENASQMTMLPCKHGYHPSCLANAFQHSLAGGMLFICCNKEPVPIGLAAAHLSAQFVTNYEAKTVEQSTPNPIYCAKPGCAAFVPPINLKGPMATCQKCGFVTCSLCKNPEHKGICPLDQDGKKLLKLANSRNWTQCQRCKAMIERYEGCLHMTCTCKHEFCYSCGGIWAKCGGRCPRVG